MQSTVLRGAQCIFLNVALLIIIESIVIHKKSFMDGPLLVPEEISKTRLKSRK